MSAAGVSVRAFKPVVTGLGDPIAAEGWPADHELLALAAGERAQDVAPLLFDRAVSPHLAAELAGAPIDPATLIAHARAAAEDATLIAEGVGGLLVPLTPVYSVCDLACELGLPVLIAARPGLGTINHTLLTLRVARAAGLEVRAVVLTPWPEHPDAIAISNRETIAELGAVEVAALPPLARPEPAAFAAAGDALEWRRWLER